MRPINEPAHRYEELAGFVAGLVEKGTLRPGSRAPSLRRSGRDRRASLTTALKAYQLLERHADHLRRSAAYRNQPPARRRAHFRPIKEGRLAQAWPGTAPTRKAAPMY